MNRFTHLVLGTGIVASLLVALFPRCMAQTHLGNLTSYVPEGKRITLWADTARVRLIFYAPDIVRVDYLPSPATVLDPSLVVVQDTNESVSVTVNEAGASIEITTSSLRVVCTKTPLRLTFSTISSKILLDEGTGGGFAANGNQRSVSFQLGSNDHFYGTGERGINLDKRGQAFESYNDTFFGYTTPLPRMNINVPFVACSNGYALYFENTYPGAFDLGAANPSTISYTAFLGELSYYVIAAPTVQEQLDRYTWLTGRQPLPPRWAFGYIQSKYGYQTESEAAAIVQTMRRENIPCDAIVLDLYWYSHMGDLSWNLASWPTPFQMMSDFLRSGIKTIVITEPYLASNSSNFAEAAGIGFLGRTEGGQVYLLHNWWSCGCDAGLFDITNPAAQGWWWNKHPSFLGSDSSGVAGLWTDLGEPENHPQDMQHFLGNALKIHNIYNLLWAKTIFEGFNRLRPDHRVFNLTRSGYAGIQRYGVLPWSGDVGNTFGGLAAQLPMVLNMGMSGLVYHHSDIGGFCCGATSPELYVRWMQYGTFCPITRAHGMGRGTEPWSYDAQAEVISRQFIGLRYRLLPYIYTMAYASYQHGLPLVRPLFFEDPANVSLAGESSSYLWGDAFLVSPVVEQGQMTKSVTLPTGATWIDYWTGEHHAGGQIVTVATPLETMPLFVRAGSIIPMQPQMQYSDQHPLDTLLLDLYPATGVGSQFDLYEDDGKSLEYQSGQYAITPLQQTLSGSGSSATLTLSIGPSQGTYSGMPARRIYVSMIHGVAARPATMQTNGHEIPERTSYGLLRQGQDGFFFDSLAHMLYVQTPASHDSAYTIEAGQVQLTAARGGQLTPGEFRLEQNYPNPFNPQTLIRFTIPSASHVALSVFDILGREVATLIDRSLKPGSYEATFDGSGFSSGVYFYKITAGNLTQTKKMILAK